MLPQVFITEETEPLKSPPMSMQMAQDTETVSSSPASAMVRQTIAAIAPAAKTPGNRASPAIAKPPMETVNRPRRRSFQRWANRSDNSPPATLVMVAASSGRLAKPVPSRVKWRASRRYVGNQARYSHSTQP